jgi:hypothetical protein
MWYKWWERGLLKRFSFRNLEKNVGEIVRLRRLLNKWNRKA